MSDAAGSLLAVGGADSRAGNARRRWAFALLLALITLAELFFAYKHSDFNNDDLDHFVLASKSGLLAYMMTPVEAIHIVPFHRLLTFLIYRFAPMNFMVSLGVLGCIHAATLYYLSRIGRLLNAGIFGNVIVLCYALSALNIYLFVWWASAAHRIPYLALSACMAYHYLASLREGALRRHAVIAGLAFVIGCGFYIKTVLVPFYLTIYGLAVTGFAKDAWRRVLRLPVFLAVGSAAYLLAYHHFVHPVHASISFGLKMSSQYLLALLGNLIGFTLDSQFIQIAGLFNVWTVSVVGAWLVFMFMTAWRNRRVMLYWLLFVGVVFLDFLPIATSSRSLYFASIVPYSVRYHADALVITAVMLLIIASALVRRKPPTRPNVRVIAAICIVTLYASATVLNLRSDSGHRALMFSTFAHSYMKNLRKGLRKIHETRPSFVVTPVPKGLDWVGDVSTSDRLVPLFKPKATFSPTQGHYRVLMDGHIELVQSVQPK